MKSDLLKPDLYDYLDVTQFLNDVFRYRKVCDPSFSYASWASELKLGSKTVLRFILKRERRISSNTLTLLIDSLGFHDADKQYFETLVSYSQAKTEQERKAFGAALNKLQRNRYQPLEVEDDVAAKSALSPIILTLLSFRDVVGEAEALAKLMGESAESIEVCLADLERSGLIAKSNDGTFSFQKAGFRVADRSGSVNLRRFHEHWIAKAKQSIDLPPRLRKFRALQFALNEDEFQQALERINDFAIALLSTFNSRTLENRRLYMLESLLFPVANIHPKSEHTSTSKCEIAVY